MGENGKKYTWAQNVSMYMTIKLDISNGLLGRLQDSKVVILLL